MNRIFLGYGKKVQDCDQCKKVILKDDHVIRVLSEYTRYVYHLECWIVWTKNWFLDNPYDVNKRGTGRKKLGLSDSAMRERGKLIRTRGKLRIQKEEYIGTRLWMHAALVPTNIDKIDKMLKDQVDSVVHQSEVI